MKKTLKLIIIFSVLAALLLSAGLVWGLVGLNSSIAFSGGNRLTIVTQSQEDCDNAQNLAAAVLKQNKVNYEVSQKNNGAEFSVVFETKNKNIPENVVFDIETAIAGIENTTVNGFDSIDSTFKTKAWVIGVTTACLALAVFVFVFILTKRWADVFAFAIGFVVNALAVFALFVVCRIEFNSLSVFSFAVACVLYAICGTLVAIRTKRAKNKAANQDKDEFELSNEILKNNFIFDLPVFCVMLVTAIVCVSFGKGEIIYFGAGLAIAVAVAFACSCFIQGYLRALFENAFETKYQKKMSAPVAISSEAQAQSKQKQDRPKTAQKPQVVVRKRKRRNTSGGDKVTV